MKVLVTGTKSGLGRYIHETIGGAGISRDTIIVHCAHTYVRDIEDNYDHFRDENIELTRNLVKLPHQKFIFISSIDILNPSSMNGSSKLASEQIVEHDARKPLIIRPSLILGRFQRLNTVVKIKLGILKETTLSEKSEFYYIYNEEILEFIKKGIKENLVGTYTIGMEDKVRLKDLTKFYKRKINFGKYFYKIK